MKRIVCLILACLVTLLALTACKKEGPVITGNDGATYEQVVDKDGNPVMDSSGNPVVVMPKSTNASGKEQEGATQSLTIPYIASSGKTIEAAGYRMDIPKDWAVKAASGDLLLESKEGTLQISIMDKSDATSDRKAYAEIARNSLIGVGNKPGEITEATVAGKPASKFTSSIQAEEGAASAAVFFVVENAGKIYAISGTAQSEEMLKSANFDAIFDTIQFK